MSSNPAAQCTCDHFWKHNHTMGNGRLYGGCDVCPCVSEVPALKDNAERCKQMGSRDGAELVVTASRKEHSYERERPRAVGEEPFVAQPWDAFIAWLYSRVSVGIREYNEEQARVAAAETVNA